MKKKSEGKTQLDKKIKFILEESIPKGQEDRKKYVADIAFFYSTIFKSKLEHFIGLQLEDLAIIGRSEEYNDIVRANINCFRLIDTWMNEKTNEHFGNLEELRDSIGENEDFINNMKKEYGEI